MKVTENSACKKTSKSRPEKVMRNRIKYSDIQLACLEKVFCHTQYPDSYTMEELTNTLEINGERLAIWFQNRRSKFKRQSKDGYVSWMRNQLYQNPHTPLIDVQPRHGHVLSAAVQTAPTDPSSRRPSSNLHYLAPARYVQQSDVPSLALTSCRYQLAQSAMFSPQFLSAGQSPPPPPPPYRISAIGGALPGQELSAPLPIPASASRVISCPALSNEHAQSKWNPSCPDGHSWSSSASSCARRRTPSPLGAPNISISNSPGTSSDTSASAAPQAMFPTCSDISPLGHVDDDLAGPDGYDQSTAAGLRAYTYQAAVAGAGVYTYHSSQYVHTSGSPQLGRHPAGC